MFHLELVGVPEYKNKYLRHYVMRLAERAEEGFQLRPEDIDHANRVQKMNPNKDYPPNIIFRFNNQTHKDSLLSSLISPEISLLRVSVTYLLMKT